jgi:hypothetical protein
VGLDRGEDIMSGRFSGHATHRPHGSGVRGLSPDEVDKRTRFGHLLPKSQAEFSAEVLRKLAAAMRANEAQARDGEDDEESHIPAAYTYLGQFFDHDITFDPSTFQQQREGALNLRTPRLDLDNLYGRGPSDQPYLYDGTKLLLGDQLVPVRDRNPAPHDLPRAGSNSLGVRRAIIADPRNDENVIVSQLHGLFLQFHNAVADLLGDVPFERVQEEVRWHYQWMALHDFLPQIVDKQVLDEISPEIANPSGGGHGGWTLSLFSDEQPFTFMPVEFSVAAYRMGHSMVRPGYRLNERTAPLRIFDPNDPLNGLNAFGDFPKGRTVDWQRFINLGKGPALETATDRVQLAYSIDTSLVEPLGELPQSVAGDEAQDQPDLKSLAFRNLTRGALLHLATGQEAVAALNHRRGHRQPIRPLRDQEILIGPVSGPADEVKAIAEVDPAFAGKCPLWTYVLAEARHHRINGGKAQLTGVGGRLVAEVFVGLLARDGTSFLHQPDWKPYLAGRQTFSLVDFVKLALGLQAPVKRP